MNCTSITTSRSSTKLSNQCNLNSKKNKLNLNVRRDAHFPLKFPKCIQTSGLNTNLSTKLTPRMHIFPVSFVAATVISLETTSDLVSDKLQRLVFEFKSLSEPIDRVKRLLHYAALLSPLDDSARVPENRVAGCTTQVWLDAKMDESGRMRFKADSDSEITKGFCSCLIWMLDCAEPDEVLEVKKEDLEAMNIGLHGKAQSRVNTWHNVLISMQKRTKALVAEKEAMNLP